jgi:hypothetical protein
VWDGTYDRANNTDFPAGSTPPAKGNGQLFNYLNVDGLNAWFIKDFQINTSGGSKTNVTVWWLNADAWGAVSIGYYLDWIEVNEGAGGSGNLITINFNNSSPITMELTGTEGDYGFAFSPELPFLAGGYSADGYFTTTNFLAGLSYNATVLLTNTTIPSGSINAQISNDGTTWSDLGGLANGYEALDLRGLGFVNSTLMFNYTRGLVTETPQLFQVRLVHEGPGNGTTTTTDVDEAPYIAIGLILAMAMVLIAGRLRK